MPMCPPCRFPRLPSWRSPAPAGGAGSSRASRRRARRSRTSIFSNRRMLICLLSTIGPEGLSGKPAAALADAIVQAAARLGARWQTPDTLRKLAGQQVDEIVERVKSSGQRGKLKHWNTRYRHYRHAQVAKAEKAIPYSSFLEQVVINADRAR